MEFTNWFDTSTRVAEFEEFLAQFKGKPVSFLQLGAFTGDATTWLLENILTHPDATLTDVDTWEGSDESAHDAIDFSLVEEKYTSRGIVVSALESGRLDKFKGTTDEFFKQNVRLYDFIYVDADHTAYGVLKDAVNSYEALKIGGVLGFDDYEWGASKIKSPIYSPKLAINSFENVYENRVRLLKKTYLAWYQKVL
jgi:hypothetical protein